MTTIGEGFVHGGISLRQTAVFFYVPVGHAQSAIDDGKCPVDQTWTAVGQPLCRSEGFMVNAP